MEILLENVRCIFSRPVVQTKQLPRNRFFSHSVEKKKTSTFKLNRHSFCKSEWKAKLEYYMRICVFFVVFIIQVQMLHTWFEHKIYEWDLNICKCHHFAFPGDEKEWQNRFVRHIITMNMIICTCFIWMRKSSHWFAGSKWNL